MANRFPPCLFPLPISSPLRSLLSPLILSHPGTDVHLLKVAHDGIGQRRMRKEEAATHGGGCVDLLHCAMHEEGGGSGFPIRAHTFPKFSLRSNINLLHGAVWTVEDEAVLPGRWSGGRKASAQLLSQNQCWDKASKQNV
uniref:Uncharacterized protein n=1 Tax=Oryza nivara TaxID=4536 RepID=A0A0E0IQS9_ORYNI